MVTPLPKIRSDGWKRVSRYEYTETRFMRRSRGIRANAAIVVPMSVT